MKRNSPKLKWKIIIEFILFALIIYLGFWFIQNTITSIIYKNNSIKLANQEVSAIADIIETNDVTSKDNVFKVENANKDGIIGDIWVIYSDKEQLKIAYSSSFMEMKNEVISAELEPYWNDNYGTNSTFKEQANAYYTTGEFVTDQNGVNCLVLVKTRLVRPNADQRLNSVQFIISTAFIFISALLFGISLTHQLVMPLVTLNNAAKDLAKGKYDAKFNVTGFEEVENLGETLTYASQELSKMDVYQKELLANVSHDLRTPLTLIGGYAEMMKDMPDERTEDNLQIIIDETKRLNNLVNDILLLSNIQNDKNKLELETYSITESIKEIIYRNDKMTNELGIKISFECDQDVSIVADEAQITKVIYNFISNAINYCGDDKIVIVRQTVKDDYVTISVIDHGVGIDENEIKNIWDRYYKAKNHVRAQAGSGLGLSIVKSILQRHNFEYGVNSKKNEGSEFWFRVKL